MQTERSCCWLADFVPVAWNADLPVYASEKFLRSAGSEFGWVAGRDPEGRQRCVLPFAVIRRAGLRLIRFQTEVVPLGAEFTVEEERAFLDGVVQLFRSKGADMIIPGTNAAVFPTYPDGADAAPYGTLVKDLTRSEEELLREVHPTFRYNIRRAQRDGVQIKEGSEYLETAYSLVAATLARSGQKFKKFESFRLAIESLGGNVKIFAAERGGDCHGCMIAPFSQYAAYTWYCGSRDEPTLGAMHLLHWEAIRRFKSMGVRLFDFQGVRIDPENGSKQEGILNFKSRFGGTLVKGYTWKYPFRPVGVAVYSLGMKLLQGGDIVDVERHKLDHFNAEQSGLGDGA